MRWRGLEGLAENLPFKLSADKHKEPAQGDHRREHSRQKEQLDKGPRLAQPDMFGMGGRPEGCKDRERGKGMRWGRGNSGQLT